MREVTALLSMEEAQRLILERVRPLEAEPIALDSAAGRVLARHSHGSRTRNLVIIGKDTRISGYMFESALEAGLVAAGLDVTLLGPMFAAVGTGSFFVESIFRVPGMGRFFVLSMTGRDYPMIMAVVLIYGAFLALMNLVVDLLYGALDPRIRY